MAYFVFSKPGTESGVCPDVNCKHTDYKATRLLVESNCKYCAKPVGYDVRYYFMGGTKPGDLVHCLCEAEQ